MKLAFSGKRYATCGVMHALDPLLQSFLWGLVDRLVAEGATEADYLQIFELSPAAAEGSPVLEVVHRQEQPPYAATHRLPAGNPVRQKVYVIDDGDHCTMLLAEEY